MHMTGMIRKVDELGRVVIPKEIRERLNIKNKDDVDVSIEKGSVIIKKLELDSCTFCGNNKKLVYYNNIPICNKCLKNISKLIK